MQGKEKRVFSWADSQPKAARTLCRHNMNRQSLPPLYPIQEKNRISCMDTAQTDSMQHTRTWKRTYTGNDRQLQSSRKKIARQIEM